MSALARFAVGLRPLLLFHAISQGGQNPIQMIDEKLEAAVLARHLQ
jgi:hypothetical protein